MYTEIQRSEVRERFISFLNDSPLVEAAFVTGTGAIQYRDLLSHISMTLCMKPDASASEMCSCILQFCRTINEKVFLHEKCIAGKTIAEVFWAGGLSMNLELGLTETVVQTLPSQWKLVVDKVGLERIIPQKTSAETCMHKKKMDDGIKAFDFYYAVRRCEMGLVRNEPIMADMQLGTARKLLLDLELVREGMEPRFMNYSKMDTQFLQSLGETYPAEISVSCVHAAKDAVVHLYQRVYQAATGMPCDERLAFVCDYETEFAEN